MFSLNFQQISASGVKFYRRNSLFINLALSTLICVTVTWLLVQVRVRSQGQAVQDAGSFGWTPLDDNSHYYRFARIDGCDYVVAGNPSDTRVLSITHKANCGNPQHQGVTK